MNGVVGVRHMQVRTVTRMRSTDVKETGNKERVCGGVVDSRLVGGSRKLLAVLEPYRDDSMHRSSGRPSGPEKDHNERVVCSGGGIHLPLEGVCERLS